MSEKIRVAAYVRVSMETAQMRHSLTAQQEYYEELIAEHAEWEFAGIYTDCGISGTNVKKREGFRRMLQDCEAGKVDRILVKSVSRFARNTVDLLETVRYLRKRGISVWFEEQQMDSMTEEGELMLTLMASVAQAESESISENARWAIQKRFQSGIANTKRRTFGYQWIEGRLTVVPEEAEVVRRIFANFLVGGSHTKMAEELTREGVTTICGNAFSTSAISTILRNVTYTGNTLLQKTWIQDPITKKKLKNTGQLPRYFVPDTHEAIIEMETYQKVQEKLEQNRQEGRFPYNHTGEKYPFTGKVICGCCGRHYTRQLWNTGKKGEKRATWVCTRKKSEKYRWCDGKNFSEETLKKSCAAALDLKDFDETVFAEKVDVIQVESTGKVNLILKNGARIPL